MESLLISVNILLAVVLVISVLLQKSEGGALGLGVSQDNFTSTRAVGSFLTKFTSIIANIPTIPAYPQLGFGDWGEIPSILDFDGLRDLILWRKNLPEKFQKLYYKKLFSYLSSNICENANKNLLSFKEFGNLFNPYQVSDFKGIKSKNEMILDKINEIKTMLDFYLV